MRGTRARFFSRSPAASSAIYSRPVHLDIDSARRRNPLARLLDRVGSRRPRPVRDLFQSVANGRGVGWMFERRVGDTIEFSGPFGNFTIDAPPAAETGFIAEGTAIAPIRPMLKRALANRRAQVLRKDSI